MISAISKPVFVIFFPQGMERFCCCEEKKTTSYQFLAKMKKWKNETYVITAPCKKRKMNKRNFIISAPGPLAKKRRKSPRHIRPSTPCKRKNKKSRQLGKKRKEEENIYVISAPRHLSIAQLFPNCSSTLLQ